MTTAITTFDPKEVATFGNSMLKVLVQHETDKESAERQLEQANAREEVINFELARVALFLHAEERVDLYNVYEDTKESSSKLYRTILVETGVLARKVDEATDKVVYDFTDEALENQFNFSEELKSSDEEEYKRRRSRRNALNMRLAKVCKAALALHEAQATIDDMALTQENDGSLTATISKGPADVMGEVGTVQIMNKSVAPVTGATVSPTISGLARVADKAHKTTKLSSKNDAETSTRKDSVDTKDFTAIVNAALIAIRSCEGTFTATQRTLLKNVLTELQEAGIK